MPRWILIVLAALAVIVAACNSASIEPTTSLAGSTTTATTSTTILASIEEEPDESIDCPNFVAAEESVADLPSVQEAKLYAPGGKISEHVFTNTEEFGGARVVREPTRIEVGVKTNINANCWELRNLVARKSTFHVVRVPHSLADVQVAAEAAAARGATTSAVQGQSVQTYLPASGEAVAAELHAEYGDMLELSVGGWSYPNPSDDDEIALFCRSAEDESAVVPGLRINAEPANGPIYAIGDGWRFAAVGSLEMALTFENTSDEAIGFSLPQASLPLYRDGELVSVLSGYIDVMQAPKIYLLPGESAEVSAVVGLSPCSLDDGYSVPPGIYTSGVVVGGGSATVLGPLSEPVSVEVIAAPSEALEPRPVPSVTAPPTTLDR